MCGPATDDQSPSQVLVRSMANVDVGRPKSATYVGDVLTIARQIPWYPAVQRLVHERDQLEVDAASNGQPL